MTENMGHPLKIIDNGKELYAYCIVCGKKKAIVDGIITDMDENCPNPWDLTFDQVATEFRAIQAGDNYTKLKGKHGTEKILWASLYKRSEKIN